MFFLQEICFDKTLVLLRLMFLSENRIGMMKLKLKYEKLMMHIAAWLLVFVFPAYLMYLFSGVDAIFIRQLVIHALFFVILFYLNYLWFSRWWFQHGRKWRSVLASLLLLAFMTIAFDLTFDRWSPRPKPWHHHPGSERRMEPPNGGRPPRPGHKPGKPVKKIPAYNFMFTGIFVSVLGFGLRYAGRTAQLERQQREMEKEKIAAELAYLKNQISPHFFFNTLNNIYSLIEANPKEGQHAIHSLSKMMRFMLYETDRGDVSLAEEVAFLKNYIQLMRLRLTDHIDVSVTLPEVVPPVTIPPLLFLPFIENAFKHGVSNVRPSMIFVDLEAAPGVIRFRCRNTIHEELPGVDDRGDPGIGLENVRRRLGILMPDCYHLKAEREGNIFVVELDINLEEKHP
jgi:two-component system, LytTR family, sensor kinase